MMNDPLASRNLPQYARSDSINLGNRRAIRNRPDGSPFSSRRCASTCLLFCLLIDESSMLCAHAHTTREQRARRVRCRSSWSIGEHRALQIRSKAGGESLWIAQCSPPTGGYLFANKKRDKLSYFAMVEPTYLQRKRWEIDRKWYTEDLGFIRSLLALLEKNQQDVLRRLHLQRQPQYANYPCL